MTEFQIWAQFILCENDSNDIANFFEQCFNIPKSIISKQLHLTVYHSKRPMPEITPIDETINLSLPIKFTRFMVMKPQGINPNPSISPKDSKVGIRIQKQNPLMTDIIEYRERISQFENEKVLRKRLPSSINRNAFGARQFIPHITLLEKKNKIDYDLSKIGNLFRERFEYLRFDKFIVDINKEKKKIRYPPKHK